MEVDSHERQASDPVLCDETDDVFPADFGFRQGDGRFQRPVLRGDTIQFKNIDGPRSLMTAWKKLVSTSASLRRESELYLSRGQQHRGRGLREHEADNRDDFCETALLEDWGVGHRPDAFHHSNDDWTFDDGEGAFWESSEPEDTFYDCEVSPLHEDLDQGEHCCQTLDVPEACRAAHKNPKKSLHVRVQVEGAEILALVDTGATSSFVQQGLVKKLGLWNRV